MEDDTLTEPSMSNEKLSTLARVHLVPTSNSSVLSLLSLRKLEESQSVNSAKQLVREEEGSGELGLLEM